MSSAVVKTITSRIGNKTVLTFILVFVATFACFYIAFDEPLMQIVPTKFFPWHGPDNGLNYSRAEIRESVIDVRNQSKYGTNFTWYRNFKSPYIILPPEYSTATSPSRIDASEALKRNYTIISFFNAPTWFRDHSLNVFNRDLARCPVKECYVDFQGKVKAQADVLLFFPGRVVKPQRKSGQIWVFGVWESPHHFGYPAPYPQWKDQFNWTANYRTDADWFFPNNILTWRDEKDLLQEEEYMAIAKGKTKMVAWMVSNCHTPSQRDKYVAEMQKYIDVDIYGRCGKLKCFKGNISKCEKMLSTTYRFYLSFENSLCRDYVTEKFFRMFAYRSHVVPVGRGGFDYNKYIPGNFVVDAANFKTAKDLALYLKELAADIPRYAKYLQAKDTLTALNRKFDWCETCERLRHKKYRNGTYSDIRQWSSGPNNDVCRKPNDIA